MDGAASPADRALREASPMAGVNGERAALVHPFPARPLGVRRRGRAPTRSACRDYPPTRIPRRAWPRASPRTAEDAADAAPSRLGAQTRSLRRKRRGRRWGARDRRAWRAGHRGGLQRHRDVRRPALRDEPGKRRRLRALARRRGRAGRPSAGPRRTAPRTSSSIHRAMSM